MAKQIAINLSARENTPERALRNVTKKINEYLEQNPGSRVVTASYQFSSQFGSLETKPMLSEVFAHALVVFEQ